jgi:hypothetical protein
MAKGLRDPSASALPPCGFKINREPSKGYEIAA